MVSMMNNVRYQFIHGDISKEASKQYEEREAICYHLYAADIVTQMLTKLQYVVRQQSRRATSYRQ